MKRTRFIEKIKFPAKRCCLLLLMSIASCVPDPLELKDIPEVEPEIVVVTQMGGTNSLLVLLTKTFSALAFKEGEDPNELLKQIVVNDALVTISGPDGIADTLTFRENGIYTGIGLSFRAGETYSLRVESESMGVVTASASVQPQVSMREVEAGLYYEGLNDTLAVVTYEFRDPPEKNWYLFNVQKVEQVSQLENLINPRAFTVIFEDETFNGEFNKEGYSFSPEAYAPGDTIAVSLSNISQEYYRFMEMRTKERLSFFEFLSEPFNYPSNIQGGRGFFNLYLPDVRLLVLERQQ